MRKQLKKMIQKNPALHAILVRFYKYWITPIQNKHFQYYIHYCMTQKKAEFLQMRQYGLTEIRTCRFRSWRIGRGRDHAFRRYFLAKYDGRPCFVKIGTGDATVFNEFEVLNRLKSSAVSFSPKFLVGDKQFAENTVMIATQYVDGLQRFTVPEEPMEFDDVCRQFVTILDTLNSVELTHADIHRGNLMIAGSRLYLMDFGISHFANKENGIDYAARPGTFYLTDGTQRTYDDAYSFLCVLKKEGISAQLEASPACREIRSRVGRRCFTVTVDK